MQPPEVSGEAGWQQQAGERQRGRECGGDGCYSTTCEDRGAAYPNCASGVSKRFETSMGFERVTDSAKKDRPEEVGRRRAGSRGGLDAQPNSRS